MLNLYKISSEYIDYLYKFDQRVLYNKSRRPYIGIVLLINECEYYVSLTSPKYKHSIVKDTVDFKLLKQGEYGGLNFNNMIPIKPSELRIPNLDLTLTTNKEEHKYIKLLIYQLQKYNKSIDSITKQAKKLYKIYDQNKNSSLYKDVVISKC